MREIIKLNQISKVYNHKQILDQVDLSIYEGQSIAFTGHNGSGKSTMLKIIAGLVRPSGGKVVYRVKGYLAEDWCNTGSSAETTGAAVGRAAVGTGYGLPDGIHSENECPQSGKGNASHVLP